MALVWKNTPEPDPPQSDPPPDLDIATKCAIHAGNIAAAVVLERYNASVARKGRTACHAFGPKLSQFL
jgi:hypothetical protein